MNKSFARISISAEIQKVGNYVHRSTSLIHRHGYEQRMKHDLINNNNNNMII